MRCVLAGQNRAAVECLRFLVGEGAETLVVATASDDGDDGWQPSLVKAARRADVEVIQPAKINDPATINTIAAYQPDVLVSVQYDQILRAGILDLPDFESVNLHFALLPRHQGVAPIAWALLEGDAQAGVTLHRMVLDIDAGDVIAQRSTAIEPSTTARDLYDAVTDLAIELFVASYPFNSHLLSTAAPQSQERACYHRNGDFDFSRIEIDWLSPSIELHNWIRAMIFPPLQVPEARGKERTLQVIGVGGPRRGVSGEPGTVVEVGPDGAVVATGDGGLLITEVRDPASPSVESPTIISSLRPGLPFA